VRDTFNAWLRAGASTVVNGQTVTVGMSGHPLNGVIDSSPAVEDTTDSHYFKAPGWTTDGAHPTAQGYDAMALKVRPWMGQVLTGQRNLHAALHATGGPDAITPASIGAADALTLGGYLNAISGRGTFQDYLLRGEVQSSAPTSFGTVSTLALTSTTRMVEVMLGYALSQQISNLEFIVSTAMVGGAATMNIYTGQGNTLSKIAADVSVTTLLQSTGLKAPAISGIADGWLMAVICLTTAPSTYPVFRSVAPLDVGLLTAASGISLAGVANTTALPTTLQVNSGWTAPASVPWMSARAF
jgi:hypothetical protein